MTQGKLTKVFTELERKGVVLFLDESYCCTCEHPEDLRDTDKIGFVYAQGENPDTIMVDIVEEGSAVATWNFEVYGDNDTNKLGEIISGVFKSHRYITEWKKGLEVISTVIVEDDLPSDFVKTWFEKNYTHEIDGEDDSRVDPEEEVCFTKDEENQESIFRSSDEESEDELDCLKQ